jgi:hypothetical protein
MKWSGCWLSQRRQVQFQAIQKCSSTFTCLFNKQQQPARQKKMMHVVRIFLTENFCLSKKNFIKKAFSFA